MQRVGSDGLGWSVIKHWSFIYTFIFKLSYIFEQEKAIND